MTEIVTALFLGGLSSTTPGFLEEHHIRAVVSCCNDMDYGVPPVPITQFRVPVEDISNEPILDYMDDACDFISQHLGLGGVLVHCRSGVSRSATIVIGFLMKTLRLSLNDSFMLVLSRRSCICPNIGFMKQLCQLEEALVGGDFVAIGRFPFSESSLIMSGRVLEHAATAPAAESAGGGDECHKSSSGCFSEPPSSPGSERRLMEEVDQPAAGSHQKRISSSSVVSSGGSVSEADRLRQLGQALMAASQLSIYGGSMPSISAAAESPPLPQVVVQDSSSLESLTSFTATVDKKTISEEPPGTPPPLLPRLRVQSAGAATRLRRGAATGPTPRHNGFVTPRNAVSCVNSPENLIHSIAAKSPSLSMSKYISWYTMSGDRATAPSLAP
eukprot:Protomagalhaensia_sp_Gyna_25__1930@NODE_2024_length_1339_cov_10_830769_g1669_i0_p1_GENE_NODE_2024_length_1339_cov_10_830769_g1669_i0NODE_2024_length_1339_cov_10_830769_g1669_i0_p1_ORF_typecomplete_len386_score38_96DSPc/PF00782_20/8e32CDKN3/PF05706_12/0_00053Init_tRNA_PT/PF04179_12/0_071PTPlike_phytase/PF14566_6/0_16Y_phosphatase2/PF03162_13/0_51_NODE_2024_length_1339_cov_10_830769_g1669_i0261183